MHRRPSTNITRFTSISANGFYTLTRTGLLNTADSDAADSIPCEELRVLAADEKAMAELYAQTELLQTATQPKRLVVYKEYLLWFRDLQADEPRVPDPSSSHQKGSNAAEALTACSTSKVGSPKRRSAVLEGYANIRGMYVESNHSTKTHSTELEMSQLCKQPTVHGKLLKKTSVELHTMEELKIKWDPDIEQPKIWMVFCEQPKQLGREGLSFQTIDQYYDWRSKIAKAPVFFTDYMARYKELTDYSTMSYFRFAKIVHLQTERTLVADSRKHPGLSDTKAYKESELQAISQAKTLAYVERLNISPRLKELHYTSNSHIFLVEDRKSTRLNSSHSQISY